LAQPFDSYRLGPGDVISVYVRRFSDLDFQATIDPEGQIAHPLLGKLSLQGLSLAQAQVVVQQALDRFVIHPVVSLSLATPRPAQVTVVGEVARPGLYPLQSQAPKISAVLLAAGGTQEGADLRQVRVRRHLPNGRVMEEQLDLFTPLQQGQALPDLRLQDGDTIVIPKLTPEQAQGYDRSIVARSTLVKPKITVRVLTYARGGLGQVVLDNGSTFVDALASSGVSAVQSNLNQIALVRFDSQQKKAVTLELDGKRALLGDASQNVPLQDNDVIIVGRNLVGKITYTLGTLTQPFRDVLGFTSFFNRFGSSAWNLFDPGR
jgi:polysaccharide export outer membrane protein